MTISEANLPPQVALIPIKRPLNEDVQDAVTNLKKYTRGCEKRKENDPDFTLLQKRLLQQLNGTLPTSKKVIFKYLQDCQQEIDRIIKQSVIQKESHSVILVGPRQSYKTYLLDYELSLLQESYNEQFITIKLNGFIHSEQTAINGIATQLEQQLQKIHGNEAKIDDASLDTISSGSLTEVFEKILLLLDSATKRGTEDGDDADGSRTTKITVVFIFDEIDTFAGPVRQTLLYNLFDMVEHARVPVCIFGCTTKLNILEYLEKRVKSRFSQRVIHMPQIQSLEDMIDGVRDLLVIHSEVSSRVVEWNNTLEKELSNPRSNLNKHIRMNFETFRALPVLKNSIIPLVAKSKNFDSLCSAIKSCSFLDLYNKNQLSNSLTGRLQSLSDLELAILVSAARVALRAKDGSFNFNLAYAEYEKMIKAINSRIPTVAPSVNLETGQSTFSIDNTIKLWLKKDVKNVWETLLELDFFTEKSAVGLRDNATAAFYASNYQFQGTMIPFDLRSYQMQIILQELRRIIPRSNMYYSWTQL
ncbi:orc4p [Saccharomyces arboricola H-6]|uniref:Origin recognition complex subunit 4 n=1 Tax=Saccharomyces arboricola (strain H-6 / AS 2.3317 / CBS 10644) TaxID=1160507 RepID=J8PGJ6_SACAR|nr:orc4p [Saccharomyces arboricola H-6]